MGCVCGPQCKLWVWMYFKSWQDYKAVCESGQRINGLTHYKNGNVKLGKFCKHGTDMREVDNVVATALEVWMR